MDPAGFSRGERSDISRVFYAVPQRRSQDDSEHHGEQGVYGSARQGDYPPVTIGAGHLDSTSLNTRDPK